MSDLKNKVIKLAHDKPELRQHLLPLLSEKTARVASTLQRFDFDYQGAWKITKALVGEVADAIGGEVEDAQYGMIMGSMGDLLQIVVTPDTSGGRSTSGRFLYDRVIITVENLDSRKEYMIGEYLATERTPIREVVRDIAKALG